jgi:hypothetical protein
MLGTIVKAFTTSMATDLWGDIPYSEAFTAVHQQPILYPKFDNQKDIYYHLLEELATITGKIANFKLNDSRAHQALSRHDILLKGDLDRWERFGNSLRLRLAMRLSEVDPDMAEFHVWQLLKHNILLVESNDQNIVLESESPDGLATDRFNLATLASGSNTFAGKVMMDLMNESNDPRRDVFFQPSLRGGYTGIPSSPDEQKDLRISVFNYAFLNEDVFENNQYFPGIVITAAEVSFLKAEAYMRGWVSGDAQAAYENGLRQSIEMYYYIANLHMIKEFPSQDEIETFIEHEAVAFDQTVKQIATQKWIHFFISQPYEAFAELRRTDYPELPDDTYNGTLLPRAVRLVYPPSEMALNYLNFESVKSNDFYESRVWWDVK